MHTVASRRREEGGEGRCGTLVDHKHALHDAAGEHEVPGFVAVPSDELTQPHEVRISHILRHDLVSDAPTPGLSARGRFGLLWE